MGGPDPRRQPLCSPENQGCVHHLLPCLLQEGAAGLALAGHHGLLSVLRDVAAGLLRAVAGAVTLASEAFSQAASAACRRTKVEELRWRGGGGEEEVRGGGRRHGWRDATGRRRRTPEGSDGGRRTAGGRGLRRWRGCSPSRQRGRSGRNKVYIRLAVDQTYRAM